jgi:chloramphenicol O-acetyltransferase type B
MPLLLALLRAPKRLLWTVLVQQTARVCGHGLRVNAFSRVTRRTQLGSNVHFNGMEITGGGEVRIGDNFHSGSECVIMTQNHNYLGEELPYDSTYLVAPVTICDNVWLGRRVMVMPGVTIGEGAIIQAGSVVVGDIPACSIAGGHPARVFKMRDRDHYDRLKAAGRFH